MSCTDGGVSRETGGVLVGTFGCGRVDLHLMGHVANSRMCYIDSSIGHKYGRMEGVRQKTDEQLACKGRGMCLG